MDGSSTTATTNSNSTEVQTKADTPVQDIEKDLGFITVNGIEYKRYRKYDFAKRCIYFFSSCFREIFSSVVGVN